MRDIAWLGLLHHVPINEVLFIISVIMYLQFIRYASIFEKKRHPVLLKLEGLEEIFTFILLHVEAEASNVTDVTFPGQISIFDDFNI